MRLTPGQAVRFARLQDNIQRLVGELNAFKEELGLDPNRDYNMDPDTGEMIEMVNELPIIIPEEQLVIP